jgi:phage shock protein A
MKVDNLPIAESLSVREQLPDAIETQRLNAIEDVKARYPRQSVGYLEARVREALSNITKFRQQKSLIQSQRSSYLPILARAREREKQENLIEADDPERAGKIQALHREFNPYDVAGLEQQLRQFDESVERFEGTITEEQDTISELRELIGQCKARDQELARLGG